MMIRILSIEIENFKAIGHGVVKMPCMLNQFAAGKTDIVGIYGKNGSGKTSVVEVLALLKALWTGSRLNDAVLGDCLRANSGDMVVKAELQYWDGEKEYSLFYEVTLQRVAKEADDGKKYTGVVIQKEQLRAKEEGKRYAQKKILVAYDISHGFKSEQAVQGAVLFKRLKKIFHGELDIRLSQCAQNVSSYLCSTELRKALLQVDAEKGNLVEALRAYAIGKLIIVGRNEAGLIACNFAQPLNIYLPGKGAGQLPLPLSSPGVIPLVAYRFACSAMDSINALLPVLIKDCSISLKSLGEEFDSENERCVRCQLMVKHGVNEGPLSMESEGIKRLISILHLLIGVYNNEDVMVAVDELDSGIYEFLLGEILQVLRQGAKGQLIFTSHNLRPMEMLDAHSVLLTTNDPDDCFARFASSRVKGSTNMRNMYLRAIQLGEDKLDVEANIHSAEIAHAFIKAAQSVAP